MAATSQNMAAPGAAPRRTAEDWEEWEDDDIVTPIETAEQVLIAAPPPPVPQSTRTSTSRISRQQSSKLKRLKSRQRQKAQNAKAGIKLITDMTSLRQKGHVAYQMRTPDGKPIKFVDAAALKALEGSPTSASVGNWNWLRRKSPASASPQTSARTPGISPQDRAIPIGFAMPSDELASREFSPQTATLSPTPISAQGSNTTSERGARQPASSPLARNQQASVWSPDTPDTASSFSSARPASSLYSHATSNLPVPGQDVPPVPALPSGYKKMPHQRLISLELGGADDDDGGSPYTLFEEDGIPSPQRQAGAKGLAITPTPDSANSRSRGWWDHVVTPFTDKRFTLGSRKQRLESPKEEAEGSWNSSAAKESQPESRPTRLSPVMVQAPILRAPTPRRTPSPRTNTTQPSSSQSSPDLSRSVTQEKPQIFVTDDTHSHDVPSDYPPPYSPPKKLFEAPVRYRAVFPPGHPLHAQFPPSPGPASPGLAATMTSQGATQMSEIPITPAAGIPAHAPLPIRPVGTSLPQEHAHHARGSVNRVERERQRHEKEEAAARRLGGLWRGRGCIPSSGCFGRPGREGRKRRRVWMGVGGGILALLILIIVLSVVLTRPHHAPDVESIWVNLTDFPPMPTGVLTVVGPDNTEANSGCTEPSTLWSCSLPKEDHDSVAPYKPNQPTVIMQIQWDNGTKKSWDVPNGDPPAAVSRRGLSAASYASNLVRSDQTSDNFKSDPKAPDFQEMWFLGETTDNVTAKEKAGEPTPFYISLLKSANETVDDPTLSKRQGNDGNTSLTDNIPAPDLADDGTPAPAVMLPQPVQQPIRLFDRGLPTEHYGFYTYFRRTIFLKSVTVLNDTTENDGDVPLDENGGCAKTEADFLTTWGETRMLVQIWTKTLDANSSKLLGADAEEGSRNLIRPGTMPYPVTVSLDTHGGDPTQKLVWDWPMDDRQKLDLDSVKLLVNDISVGGTLVNPRVNGDDKFGGFDGGTGGCKCEWVNWIKDG